MKAADIVILDVRKLCDITDYFVICTGNNRRQLRAISGKLSDDLAKLGASPPHIEGQEGSPWVLLDFGDAVMHLFLPETRVFYDLELLWGDAPKVKWEKASVRRRDRKTPKGKG